MMKNLLKVIAIGALGALVLSGCAGSNANVDRYAYLAKSKGIAPMTNELADITKSDFLTKDTIELSKSLLSKKEFINQLKATIYENEVYIRRFAKGWEDNFNYECKVANGWYEKGKEYAKVGNSIKEVDAFVNNLKKSKEGVTIYCTDDKKGDHVIYSSGGNRYLVKGGRSFDFSSIISFNPNFIDGRISDIDVYIQANCNSKYGNKKIYCNEQEGDVLDEFLKMYQIIKEKIQNKKF